MDDEIFYRKNFLGKYPDHEFLGALLELQDLGFGNYKVLDDDEIFRMNVLTMM